MAVQTIEIKEKTALYRFIHSVPAIAGLVILALVFGFVLLGPYLWPYTAFQVSGPFNSPPSLAHPFGTDYMGHDLMSQVMYGARPTLLVGTIAATFATAIGFAAGLVGGYYDKVRPIVSFATDVVLSFPSVAILILIGSIYLPSDTVITSGLIAVLWASCSRAVQPQVIALRRFPYVEAAKTSGLSNLRIIQKIVAPAVFPIALAYFVLIISVSIIIATSVAFLGLANFSIISWGTMFFYAQQYAFFLGDWWWVIAPGLALGLTASAFAMVSFSLEEIMNPRLRK